MCVILAPGLAPPWSRAMAGRDKGPIGMRVRFRPLRSVWYATLRGPPPEAPDIEVPPCATPRSEDPPCVPLLEAAEATPPPSDRRIRARKHTRIPGPTEPVVMRIMSVESQPSGQARAPHLLRK